MPKATRRTGQKTFDSDSLDKQPMYCSNEGVGRLATALVPTLSMPFSTVSPSTAVELTCLVVSIAGLWTPSITLRNTVKRRDLRRSVTTGEAILLHDPIQQTMLRRYDK